MSSSQKPNYFISANYLGPIFSLEGEISNKAQNLIFARNGTGKSFLSRTFRYLDLYDQGENVSKAAFNLVSDESQEGKGSFSFSCGTNNLGMIALEKPGDKVNVSTQDTIFHVFTEDFVHDELREQNYEIDDEIENEIAVDSDNFKIMITQELLRNKQMEELKASSNSDEKFNRTKEEKLKNQAKINSRLREYKELTFDKILIRYSDKPEHPMKSFNDILEDLDSLKSIPAEPDYPKELSLFSMDDIDLVELEGLLLKETSPSSISEDIKKKIDAHHSFYKEGIHIIQEEYHTECPFCEQGITNPGPKAIIDAYIKYFSDEEEKQKDDLRGFLKGLKNKEIELNETERHIAKQKSLYEGLKQFIPSKKDTVLSSCEMNLTRVRTAIHTLKKLIENKIGTLAEGRDMPSDDLTSSITQFNKIIVE
ncbi:MAG: AAA family ATPase, partial [Rhodobacteraceae bacterium]|nr:AAA family ATPase [Paracoccaceae bacterium]